MVSQFIFNREELGKIKKNLESSKSKDDASWREKLLETLSKMCRREFWKPFLFLNLILTFGLEWAGFPALAFYMHSILKQMNTPIDEYWVAGNTGFSLVDANYTKL